MSQGDGDGSGPLLCRQERCVLFAENLQIIKMPTSQLACYYYWAVAILNNVNMKLSLHAGVDSFYCPFLQHGISLPERPLYPFSRTLNLPPHEVHNRMNSRNSAHWEDFPLSLSFRTLLHETIVQPSPFVVHANELAHPWMIPILSTNMITKFTLSLVVKSYQLASIIPQSYPHKGEEFHNYQL